MTQFALGDLEREVDTEQKDIIKHANNYNNIGTKGTFSSLWNVRKCYKRGMS